MDGEGDETIQIAECIDPPITSKKEEANLVRAATFLIVTPLRILTAQGTKTWPGFNSGLLVYKVVGWHTLKNRN